MQHEREFYEGTVVVIITARLLEIHSPSSPVKAPQAE